MLHSRLKLISAYLDSIPPCYLTTPATATKVDSEPSNHQFESPDVNHTVLRTISSMLARLPVLVPPSTTETSSDPSHIDKQPASDTRQTLSNDAHASPGNNSSQQPLQTQPSSQTPYAQQIGSQRSDVALVNLLASMTRSLHATRETRQKQAIIEAARSGGKGDAGSAGKMGLAGMAGAFGGGRFEDGLGF